MVVNMLSVSKRTARRKMDRKLTALSSLTDLEAPAKGWLRAIRESLGLSAVQLSRRLGVARQSAEDIEKSEAAGSIRLDTLRKTAAALDCTLVYAIVPNRPLEGMVERRAREKALAALSRVDQTMLLEDQRVTGADREQLIADYIAEHIRDRDLWDE